METSSRPALGGLAVTVIGTAFANLESRLACLFNKTAVPFTFESNSLLVCVSPAKAKGDLLHVQISYDNGTYSSNAKLYGYYGGIRLSPSTGPVQGGTSVVIQSAILSCYPGSEGCAQPVAAGGGEGVSCRFSFLGDAESVDTVGQLVTQGQIRVIACLSPQVTAEIMALVNSSTHPSNFNDTGLIESLVSFTLLGTGAFSDVKDSLLFVFYPDPTLLRIVPTFSSGAGGSLSTIFGTGFLPFLGQRLRFSGNSSVYEWSPVNYVTPTVMIANISKRCTTRQQELCSEAALNLQPSVSLAVNGQQFTGNALAFRYYDVSSIMPSGGSLEGGTPITVFGTGFDIIRAKTPVKCRFSHNFVEIPATPLSSSSVFCISPQGRQTSSVEICIGTNYSLTDPEFVGCMQSFTSNHVIFVSYSLYPLVSIRPDNGPSVGGFQVAMLLDSSMYSALQLSEEAFRAYGRIDQVKCKFGGVKVVAATLLSATRAVCTTPSYTAADDELAGSNLVQFTLNGWDWSMSSVYMKYQIVLSLSPFGSPATCTDPPCLTYRLTCDWCTAEPTIDVQTGTCQKWEPIYVNGFRVKPSTITVTGINLDQFSPNSNVEGGYPYPRCKLGSLNVFNATMIASGLVPEDGQLVTSYQLGCPLPAQIYMAAYESPAMTLEVSLNGRDFTDSSLVRISGAATWSSHVRSFCPPIVVGIKPSSGTSSKTKMALVTLQGTGFDASLSAPQGVNMFAKCGFGGYPRTAATVISDTQMICTAPAHPVAESLPVSITLNGDIVQPFPDVTFTYMKLDWVVPSTGPVDGGTSISLFGENLLAIIAGSANFSTAYFCRFGETMVMGSYNKKLDATVINPRTGAMYAESFAKRFRNNANIFVSL